MFEFNLRAASLAPSVTLALNAKVKALQAAGEHVLGFTAGEPDFDTPRPIKDAALHALLDGQTKYTAETGLLTLREAIAHKLKVENGLDYKARQVVVCNGAKHALFNLILVLVRDGDEVLIPAPYWLSYPEMVRLAGGRPVALSTREDRGFKLMPADLEAAITPRSRLLILNSPSNPTGLVYTRDELRALGDVAVRHGLLILSDEIYEKLVFDGAEHVSMGAACPEAFGQTITVNGFSKAFAMTGWRLGYLAAPTKIAEAVARVQSHTTSGPNTFAQFGALAALRGGEQDIRAMVATFARRRERMYSRLTAMPGVTCVKPMGAFYMLPNISASGLDSLTFCERLIEARKLAVVPGGAFGADTHVRLSYACDEETLDQGLDRFEAFVRSL